MSSEVIQSPAPRAWTEPLPNMSVVG